MYKARNLLLKSQTKAGGLHRIHVCNVFRLTNSDHVTSLIHGQHRYSSI